MYDVLNIDNSKIVCKLDSFINCFEGDNAEQFLDFIEAYFDENYTDYTRLKVDDETSYTQMITMRASELPNYLEKLEYFNNGYNVLLCVGDTSYKFATKYTITNIDGCLVAVKKQEGTV